MTETESKPVSIPVESLTLTANGLSFSARAAGKGPLVLLLHGFPDDNRTWDEHLRLIAAAGYRAVAPVMRGYEPSSQSSKDLYHLTHLASDVFGWMQCLGESKAHLIGHDWGALTTYVAAALAPQKFYSITTIAIPHLRRSLSGARYVPEQLLKSSYILLMQLPWLSEKVVERDNYAFLDFLWRQWSPSWNFSHDQLNQMKGTMAQSGVVHAATQYYRCLLNPASLSAQQSVVMLSSKTVVPTLALTGENDGCMDSRLYDYLMDPEDFPAGVEVHRLPGVGHWLHREDVDVSSRLILSWLGRHS